jgi:serine/threonine protein kinase
MDASVGLKVVLNNKDYVDAGLAEVRILSLIQQHGGASRHLLQLHNYFYWREHLILVTELQHDSLCTCYRSFERDEDRLRFFDSRMMASLSSQMLEACSFLHGLGVTHCDIKSENICRSATQPGDFTLIDFGSAVMTYDVRAARPCFPSSLYAPSPPALSLPPDH